MCCNYNKNLLLKVGQPLNKRKNDKGRFVQKCYDKTSLKTKSYRRFMVAFTLKRLRSFRFLFRLFHDHIYHKRTAFFSVWYQSFHDRGSKSIDLRWQNSSKKIFFLKREVVRGRLRSFYGDADDEPHAKKSFLVLSWHFCTKDLCHFLVVSAKSDGCPTCQGEHLFITVKKLLFSELQVNVCCNK